MPPKRSAPSAPSAPSVLQAFIAPDDEVVANSHTSNHISKKRKSDAHSTAKEKGKGKRKGKGKGKGNEEEDEDEEEKEKGGSVVTGGGTRDDRKGEEFWEISGKRRVTVSLYGGKRVVSVREYYEKDGEALPGKKGISLTLEQFNAVIELLPHIESVLVGKGDQVSRPNYTERTNSVEDQPEAEGEGGGEEEEEEEEEAEVKKKNFEETSEDEAG